MKLIGVQFNIAWEDRAANHRKVIAMLEASPPQPGDLVALPELFNAGFSMNVAAIADPAIDERFLCDTARQFRIYLVGGIVAKAEDGRGKNLAVVATPDGAIVSRYSKLHPYSPGKEKAHYVAGNEIATFAWGDVTVTPLICYDLRFPEAFRAGMQRGTKVFVVIASWPSPRVEHWITLLRARAIENQAYVLGVNRCGNDPHLPYPGRSLIVGYRGDVLADAGDGERVISADVNLAELAAYRKSLPFLDDVRADLLPPTS